MSTPTTPILLGLIASSALRGALVEAPGYDARIADPSFDPPYNVVPFTADLHPGLIVIEAHDAQIGATPWLSYLRSDPATRRIPVVAIAEGKAAEWLAQEYRLPIYSFEAFRADLSTIIARHLRVFTQGDVLAAQCDAPLSDLVRKGLEEFNAGEYYECHETLEHAWMAERGPVRDVYRAILQVGVAYYQIQRGNYQGARKMFLRSVQWFAPLPDRCHGIDIAGLRADVAAVRAHLESLGPDRIGEFDRSLLRPVRYEGH